MLLSNILIVPCRDEDIPAITDIYAQYVRSGAAAFELEPPSAREMSRRRMALRSNGFPYLVAFCNDTLVGFAYAGPYNARPAYRYSVENSIYVHPSYTGNGVGRMLLDSLIRETELRGFRQMIGIIGDSANLPAIALHERCNFNFIGVFRSVGFRQERWVDVVLMQRELAKGGAAAP